MALNAFGLPHAMGYTPTKSGEKAARIVSIFDLMDAAVELNLSGVEFPIPTDPATVKAAADALRQRNLSYVADLSVPLDEDTPKIRQNIQDAVSMGAKVVRIVLSSILCGDRRKLEGGWDAHLSKRARQLREILPHAQALGVPIAAENHQDATSSDLLHLADMLDNHPAFGVTLDAGNPLAVCEDPLQYATRIAHLIRHIHLKDYTIHFAPEGYRLVRCVAGSGVVDFPAILKIVRANGHPVLPGIEIAAQPTRTIPMLESDWRSHYPKSQSEYLPAALKTLWAKGRPMNESYSSAWERGENSATVVAEEWDVVRRSAAYFHGLEQ